MPVLKAAMALALRKQAKPLPLRAKKKQPAAAQTNVAAATAAAAKSTSEALHSSSWVGWWVGWQHLRVMPLVTRMCLGFILEGCIPLFSSVLFERAKIAIQVVMVFSPLYFCLIESKWSHSTHHDF